MPGKEEEAAALMKSGKKHTTKTMFKWTPDWDDGASDFEKAGKIYTHLEMLPQAREAFNLASMCHEKAGNLYLAGKSLEGLADFLKDQDGFVRRPGGAAECTELYCRASKLYALDRKPDRQADALARAARVAQSGSSPSSPGPTSGSGSGAPAGSGAPGAPDAAKLILEGVEALEEHDKHHLTPDLYRAALLLLVRGGRFVEAIETLKRQINAFARLHQDAGAAKAGLEAVVLALALGDWVLADRLFRELTAGFGFPHSREQAVACELLAAVEERDAERLEEALGNQTLTFLIPDVARLAKKLSIAHASAKAPAAKAGAAAAAPPLGGEGEAGDDEDEDLC